MSNTGSRIRKSSNYIWSKQFVHTSFAHASNCWLVAKSKSLTARGHSLIDEELKKKSTSVPHFGVMFATNNTICKHKLMSVETDSDWLFNYNLSGTRIWLIKSLIRRSNYIRDRIHLDILQQKPYINLLLICCKSFFNKLLYLLILQIVFRWKMSPKLFGEKFSICKF